MEKEANLSNIITNVLSDLKDKIENGILSDTETNKKLNDQFMKMLDGSSDVDTVTSSSEDESVPKRQINLGKNVKKSFEEIESDEEEDETPKNKNQKYLKTKDEITIDDLEPVEYVEIHLEPDVKLEKIGKVISKVDNKLVVIQSVRENPDKDPPTLDEETYLFDSNRKSLGKIFETFGPVTNPFYVIRFNSLSEVTDRNLNLELDSEVFFAQSNQYTKYVFNIEQLRKQKGSDASWSNDNEPPVECLDFSDDEQEKLVKRQLKSARNKIAGAYSDSEDESVEKKSPQKNFNKSGNNSFAQKRKHDQKFSHGQNNYQPQQPAQPMMPYFYPGQMYPPQQFPPFYPPNPQMYNYQCPPQMYPPGYMYPPQQMNNFNPNFRQQNPNAHQQFNHKHNQQIVDKRFIKNNNNTNSNIVKKSF
ncbi:unnamed protein product [Brachionus calyciflorus]|uniref:H/ACA ribonucleoprotein complex non-core subunit NAF1 n=1 Tax=Brachionus calyciflorus TaxID=104777 RepID=A0A813YSX8_9BILA|nr:unnamed protein product [Brachionus calyciflorus]